MASRTKAMGSTETTMKVADDALMRGDEAPPMKRARVGEHQYSKVTAKSESRDDEDETATATSTGATTTATGAEFSGAPSPDSSSALHADATQSEIGDELTDTNSATSRATNKGGRPGKNRGRATQPKEEEECDQFVRAVPRAKFSKDHWYFCLVEGCEKRYTQHRHWKQHYLRTHKSNRRFSCPVESCDYVTLYFHDMRTHKKQEHPLWSSTYPCTVSGCDEMFTTAAARSQHHYRQHHDLRTKCEADGCSRTFESVQKMQSHMATAHADKLMEERLKFECTYDERCAIRFESEEQVEEHVRLDHREREYACTYPRCSWTGRGDTVFRDHYAHMHGPVSY